MIVNYGELVVAGLEQSGFIKHKGRGMKTSVPHLAGEGGNARGRIRQNGEWLHTVQGGHFILILYATMINFASSRGVLENKKRNLNLE